jgi:D-lactate dehydrogenase (cytochrome)
VAKYSTQDRPSTSTAGSTSATSAQTHEGQSERSAPSSTNKGVLALAVLASWLIGFGFARSELFSPGVNSAKNSTVPEYGSPDEFQHAIRELMETFRPEEETPGDLVTTNPDVLHDHGFTTFVYHEGELRLSSFIIFSRRIAPTPRNMALKCVLICGVEFGRYCT